MLAQIYYDMHLDKNPPRMSRTSGMRFLLNTWCTLGECHSQLHMCNKIFFDIHGSLLERCTTTILVYDYL